LLEDLKQYPLVYLATPYSKYRPDIETAFQHAAALAAKLMQLGMKVYSPIAHGHPLSTYGKVDPFDHSIWLPFDAAIMDKADALLVAKMQGWDVSTGIKHEIDVFLRDGKPVWYLDTEAMTVAQ
jgi:hypothetical protein